MNLFKPVELPFEYNLALADDYKNYNTTQMTRYFHSYCGRLINELPNRNAKLRAYSYYSKMLIYDRKYIKFICYHLKANILFRPITNFICNRIRSSYYNYVLDFVNCTDPNNKNNIKNKLCTLIALVWYKRLKEVVEVGSNRKYSINYKFQRIKNYE